jgi:hypothetical protein
VVVAAALDPGEAGAIALALELSADLILLDERDGRSAAERVGLRVTRRPATRIPSENFTVESEAVESRESEHPA